MDRLPDIYDINTVAIKKKKAVHDVSTSLEETILPSGTSDSEDGQPKELPKARSSVYRKSMRQMNVEKLSTSAYRRMFCRDVTTETNIPCSTPMTLRKSPKNVVSPLIYLSPISKELKEKKRRSQSLNNGVGSIMRRNSNINGNKVMNVANKNIKHPEGPITEISPAAVDPKIDRGKNKLSMGTNTTPNQETDKAVERPRDKRLTRTTATNTSVPLIKPFTKPPLPNPKESKLEYTANSYEASAEESNHEHKARCKRTNKKVTKKDKHTKIDEDSHDRSDQVKRIKPRDRDTLNINSAKLRQIQLQLFNENYEKILKKKSINNTSNSKTQTQTGKVDDILSSLELTKNNNVNNDKQTERNEISCRIPDAGDLSKNAITNIETTPRDVNKLNASVHVIASKSKIKTPIDRREHASFIGYSTENNDNRIKKAKIRREQSSKIKKPSSRNDHAPSICNTTENYDSSIKKIKNRQEMVSEKVPVLEEIPPEDANATENRHSRNTKSRKQVSVLDVIAVSNNNAALKNRDVPITCYSNTTSNTSKPLTTSSLSSYDSHPKEISLNSREHLVSTVVPFVDSRVSVADAAQNDYDNSQNTTLNSRKKLIYNKSAEVLVQAKKPRKKGKKITMKNNVSKAMEEIDYNSYSKEVNTKEQSVYATETPHADGLLPDKSVAIDGQEASPAQNVHIISPNNASITTKKSRSNKSLERIQQVTKADSYLLNKSVAINAQQSSAAQNGHEIHRNTTPNSREKSRSSKSLDRLHHVRKVGSYLPEKSVAIRAEDVNTDDYPNPIALDASVVQNIDDITPNTTSNRGGKSTNNRSLQERNVDSHLPTKSIGIDAPEAQNDLSANTISNSRRMLRSNKIVPHVEEVDPNVPENAVANNAEENDHEIRPNTKSSSSAKSKSNKSLEMLHQVKKVPKKTKTLTKKKNVKNTVKEIEEMNEENADMINLKRKRGRKKKATIDVENAKDHVSVDHANIGEESNNLTEQNPNERVSSRGRRIRNVKVSMMYVEVIDTKKKVARKPKQVKEKKPRGRTKDAALTEDVNPPAVQNTESQDSSIQKENTFKVPESVARSKSKKVSALEGTQSFGSRNELESGTMTANFGEVTGEVANSVNATSSQLNNTSTRSLRNMTYNSQPFIIPGNTNVTEWISHEPDFKTVSGNLTSTTLKTDTLSFGIFKLLPKKKKCISIAHKNNLSFLIKSGEVLVNVYTRSALLGEDKRFYVPAGMEYSIENISENETAVLEYVKEMTSK